ncbi:uncharacterized protein [Clytia hemisphaerica]
MTSTPLKTANSSTFIEIDQLCFICGVDIFSDDVEAPVYFLLKNKTFVIPLLKGLSKWKPWIFHNNDTKLCKKCKDNIESIQSLEKKLNEKKNKLCNDFEVNWSNQENIFGSPLRFKRLRVPSPSKKSKKIAKPLNPFQVLTAPQTQTITAPSRITIPPLKIPSLSFLSPSQISLLPTLQTLVTNNQIPSSSTTNVPRYQVVNVLKNTDYTHALVPKTQHPPIHHSSSNLADEQLVPDRSDETLEISIRFPKTSKTFKVNAMDTIGMVIKSFAMNSIASGIKTLINKADTRNILLQELIKFLVVEMQKYNLNENASLHHNEQYSVINASINRLNNESSEICPALTSLADGLYDHDQNQSTFFISLLLHSHNRLLSSFAYKFGYFLRWSGLRSTVPLGIIPRNENSTEGMIEIIEELSKNYGLEDEDEFLFMGGDQVTEDRARHCQAARCEEESREDRLEKFWFKNEDWHFERIAYKCVLDKLSSSRCAGDSGTFYSNAVKLGNSNATTDVMGSHYNKIKEFFQVHTSAMVVVAFTEHLGMKSVNDKIEVPERLTSVAERRRWLFGLINKMLEKFVLPEIDELTKIEERLFQKVACQQPGCSSLFTTLVGLKAHEKNFHKIDHTENAEPKLDEGEDPVFNYGCVSLSYGLLLKNLGDAIKEGDGERVVRCWKYFTYVFKSTGQAHKNYALAGLRLIASIKGLLTPAKAHELIWNRFCNTAGGIGKCIPRDLRNEHLNKIAKEHIRSLGHSNISDDNVVKMSRTIGCMEDIVRSFAQKENQKTHKKNPHEKTQLAHCISEITQANMFNHVSGRELNGFPDFKRSIYSGLEPITLKNWLVQYRHQWDIENRNIYKFDD